MYLIQTIYLPEYQEAPPGHIFKLFKPRNNTTARHPISLTQESRVINYWNNLPQDIVPAKSTPTFKFKFDNYWNIIGHVCNPRRNQRPIAY